MDESRTSLPRAWRDLARRGAEAARTRWQLLAAEMAEKQKGWKAGSRWVGVSFAAGIAAFQVAVGLLVWGAQALTGSWGWGLLLVFGLTAVVAAIAGAQGRREFKESGFLPKETLAELRRDVEALRYSWKEDEPGPETD